MYWQIASSGVAHLTETVIAVATWVLVQVLLMAVLGVVKLSRLGDFGADLAKSLFGELGLVLILGGQCGG